MNKIHWARKLMQGYEFINPWNFQAIYAIRYFSKQMQTYIISTQMIFLLWCQLYMKKMET